MTLRTFPGSDADAVVSQADPCGQPLWRSEYPFASHWLTVPGGRCHYVDEGRGHPILLVHGNPTWSFYWRHWIGAGEGRFRWIAPDHLGCGLSDKPQNRPYRLADHIDNLVRLVESLDLRQITLVGHDWGGAIGLGAAVRRPDRFDRFVLMNTGAFPPWFLPWRIRVCRTPLLGSFAVRGLNLFVRAALRMTMTDPDRLTPAARAGYLAPFDNWANRIAVDRFVKDIPRTRSHPSYATLADIEKQLSQFADRPIQLNWGLRDWCFRPDCLERFIEIFPKADVHRYENAGHWIVEDAGQDVLSNVLQFLDRHSFSSPSDRSEDESERACW